MKKQKTMIIRGRIFMDKISFRRLQIINTLTEEDRWFKIDDLAKYLNCTEKTIRTDIKYIHTILPQGWDIQTLQGKGVYLSKPPNSSIDEIHKLFINYASSYKVILLILINNISVINEISKSLLVQYNTIYKILNRVEEILKSYNLTLSRNPFQIEGLEIYKRMLCKEVIYELYMHENDWPFELTFSFSDMKELVITTTEKHNLMFYPSSINKFVFYIGTMISRLDKELKLELDNHIVIKIKESLFFTVVSDICNQIEINDHLHIPLEERLLLTIFVSLLPYFDFDFDTDVDKVYSQFLSPSNSFFRQLNSLVDIFEENIDIKLRDNKEFIFELQRQYKGYSLMKYIPKRIRPFNPIVEYAQKHYADLYQKVQKSIRTFCIKYSYPKENNLTVAKMTLAIQATINLNTFNKRVLLLNSQGPSIQRYNTSKLVKAFGNKIKFVEFKKQKFSYHVLKDMEIDFIISDYRLDFKTIPVILIGTIITKRDLNEISKYLT